MFSNISTIIFNGDQWLVRYFYILKRLVKTIDINIYKITIKCIPYYIMRKIIILEHTTSFKWVDLYFSLKF